MSEIADCPYPGTRAFRRADHDLFFGRAEDAAAIADQWKTKRLTIVSGPVASGKTSLLQAGVYPLMEGRDTDVLPPGRLTFGETFPFAALPDYNSYTLAVLRCWSPGELPTRLAGLTVSDFVRRRAGQPEGIVFAAIDQAEDLLIDSSSGRRRTWLRQFLNELAQAVKTEPRLHLLLVTRNEALDLISATVGNGARHMVEPLTRQAAIEAITAPLAGTGRSFTDDAAGKLVTDLQAGDDGELYPADDQVEPSVLQIACARFWCELPPDVSVITPREVRAFADVDTALAAYLGETIAAVAAEHDLTASRLRSWLLGSFITESGARGYVYEGATATAGMPNAVVRDLVDKHLLTTELRSGLRWYQLLSDRLIEPLRKTTAERPALPAPAVYVKAAERALTLGEFDLAKRYAEQALRARPDLRLQAEIRSLLGNLAHERERPPEAEAHYREAEAHYREAASLFEAARDTGAAARQLAAVGQMLLAQGRANEAIKELRAAVDRAPNDFVLQTELAVALWHLGEGRTAVAILDGVLRIDAGNTEALRARGEILADLGDAPRAMLDLDRQAVSVRPSALAARGLALAELGDYPAANKEIGDAVAKAPRNGPVLLYAARVSALGGDEISTEELAQRAVNATDPPLSPQHRELALRLARHEQTSAG
jgi:tetratricopeptide (TPR) repeat protein